MHLHPKGRGASRDCLPNPPHSQNTKAPPGQSAAQQGRGGPSVPIVFLHDGHALRNAPCDGQHQGHGHVGRVFGQHAGRVADQNTPLPRSGHINVVDTRAVVRDQLKPVACLPQKARVNCIGDRRDQNICAPHRGDQFCAGHRRVIFAQLDVKKLHHAGLDRLRQSPGDHNCQLFACHLTALRWICHATGALGSRFIPPIVTN